MICKSDLICSVLFIHSFFLESGGGGGGGPLREMYVLVKIEIVRVSLMDGWMDG